MKKLRTLDRNACIFARKFADYDRKKSTKPANCTRTGSYKYGKTGRFSYQSRRIIRNITLTINGLDQNLKIQSSTSTLRSVAQGKSSKIKKNLPDIFATDI
jgi:hypothetical protein